MFTINEDKNIAYNAKPELCAICFNSAKELAALADARNWSRQDLESIWNDFAGVVPFDKLQPVKKFRNRPYGISQIWKAIQRLASEGETVAERQTPQEVVAQEPAKPLRVPKVTRKPRVIRSESGGVLDKVATLIRHKTGASMAEIMERMNWNATHTVRGRISILKSKGFTIESFKDKIRGRVYRAAS